jgi:hypothetical protein
MQKISIEQLYNGQSPSYLIGGDYLSSIAIDPDGDVSSGIKKISGAITPTAHTDFMDIDGNPMWVKPNPMTTDTLIYTDTGKLYQFDKTITSKGTPISLTDAHGNGLTYYNNYYYVAKDNDIDRFNATTMEREENWYSTLQDKYFIYKPSTGHPVEFSIGASTTDKAVAFRIPRINKFFPVNKMYFLVKRATNTSTTNIKVSFIRDNTDQPTGAVEGTPVVFPYSSLPTDTDFSIFEIDIPEQILLGNVFTYWVKIEAETSFATGDVVTFRTVPSADFPNGLLKRFETSSSSWQDVGTDKGLQVIITYEKQKVSKMSNTLYPTNGTAKLPNHVMHVHGDNQLYIADYVAGKCQINKIQTFYTIDVYNRINDFRVGQFITGIQSRAKAEIIAVDNTFQGFTGADTNVLSTITLIGVTGEFIPGEYIGTIDEYGLFTSGTGSPGTGFVKSYNRGKGAGVILQNALSLPYGMMPVSIASFGSDLAVLAIESKDDVINQGNARLYLWDTFDVSFYREVRLPYSMATALLSHNGTPFLWGGDDRGYSFSQYVGGDSVGEIFYVDDGLPPFAGAVSGENNRILWGTNTTYPDTTGAIMAFGSRNASLPKGVHNIARTDGQVTSLLVATKGTNNLVIGQNGALYKQGGEYKSIFRTKLINVGKNFTIKQITIPLSKNVNENTAIEVRAYVDNESRYKEINTINNENHGGKNKVVDYFEITGQNNFFIEFKWSKTEPLPILLPLTLEIEVLED